MAERQRSSAGHTALGGKQAYLPGPLHLASVEPLTRSRKAASMDFPIALSEWIRSPIRMRLKTKLGMIEAHPFIDGANSRDKRADRYDSH